MPTDFDPDIASDELMEKVPEFHCYISTVDCDPAVALDMARKIMAILANFTVYFRGCDGTQ